MKIGLSYFYYLVMLLCLVGCRESSLPDYGTRGPLELETQNGESFNLRELRGKKVFVFFGYTHCPDFCPLTMGKLTEVFAKLEEAEDYKVLFITVDPKRDSKRKLEQFLANYKLPALGLRGSKSELKKVAKNYGIHYEKSKQAQDSSYLMNHSTYLLLLDRRGHLRKIFRHKSSPEKIASAAQSLP